MRPLSNFAARDVETLLHPTTNLLAHRSLGPLVLERGEGIYVYDTAGKRYVEGLAGLWCTGLGYGNAELVEAAREQMERLSFSHLFGGRSHEPAIALAEKIKAMSPSTSLPSGWSGWAWRCWPGSSLSCRSGGEGLGAPARPHSASCCLC